MRNTKRAYSSFLKKSADRKLDVSLSYEEFRRLKVGDCHYCQMKYEQVALYYDKLKLKTPYMTIDRKDNLVGYHAYNCVPACFNCNRIKGSFFSSDEMLKIAAQFIVPKLSKLEEEVWEDYAQIIAMTGYEGDA